MKGKYGGLAIKEYRIKTMIECDKNTDTNGMHIVGNIPSFRNEILILVVVGITVHNDSK